MPKLEDAVVPPTEAPAVVTSVKMPPPGQVSGVANVNLEYDPNFKQIVTSVVNPTPENNKKTADILLRREQESQDEHPNEQMQLGKMVVSLLQGRVAEAYKWYNGGGVTYEKGRDVLGNEYWVPKTERGFTDKYLSSDKKPLTAEQRKEVIAKGGLLTETDRNALQTANWQNALDASVEAAKGFNSQLRASQTAAYAAANQANATNDNIDEEINLGFKLKNALGAISQMDPKRRQQLFNFVQRYNTNSENLRRSQELTGSTTAGTGQQFGGGFGGAEGTAAGGGRGTGNLGASLSAQQGARMGEQTAAARARENTLQEQQNLESAIRGELMGSLQGADDFKNFMRLVNLNQMNEQAARDIPNTVKPPGFKDVPPVDIYSGGLEALLQTRYAQQANNALIAAWNADLYKAQKEQVTTGKVYTPQELQDRFKNSEIVKGIVNRAVYKTERMLGRPSTLQKGAMILDNSGKLVPIE